MIGGLSRICSAREFEFWVNLNVDFIMLSIAWDFFLRPKNISRVNELKRSFGKNILIHPRPDGEILLSPANPSSHDQIFLALHQILELINDAGLIPKLIFHPATYRIPGTSYSTFSEKEAISNALVFYRRLLKYSEIPFVLENVYPPGIGWEEVGYDPKHFSLIDPDGAFELCLDTGHLNLSPFGLKDYFALPNKLSCIHLHSNDGSSDQHIPLTAANFDECGPLSSCLAKEMYIVLEIKQDLENAARAVEYLRRGEILPC